MQKKITYSFDSEEEEAVRKELQQMALNGSYNTTSSYTPNSVMYPDGLISFVDRHMRYLRANPKLDPRMYIANLRLMTRTGSK